MNEVCRIKDGRCYIELKIIPGASKNEFLDVRGGRLRVRVAAAPEHGKANAALIAAFAKRLNLPKTSVFIASGEKSPLKTLSLPKEAFESALEFVV
ncbi:MAG: DUF167 family protein [Spirochaetaceae bacterium]|jgi:uncharacterized protein (TIGR00251 family)|nr:DUF167 family protein [Spirochaetaceae bacterium]GMO17992.1 MAG: hypothetical protein Pg6A_04660 [Termitinemataceae bacterium]